jgi:uncharacterized protein DUF6788
MKHLRVIAKRDRLLAHPPALGDILRGSLLHRTIRHSQGCPKCERGDGHPVWVLSVGYGGVTRQISLRKELVPQVRRWLRNYKKLKERLEQVCELNQLLLRPDATEPSSRRRS